MISESCDTLTANAIPSFNSLPSEAVPEQEIDGSPHADAPYTMASMSSNGEAQRRGPHKAVNQGDKDLLDSYIKTPPRSTLRLPTDNGDHGETAAAAADTTPRAAHNVRPPAVNSINTPDCQRLSPDLQTYAREKGIELWAGGSGEGSDPLPSVHLHNTLQEFVDHMPPELVPEGSSLGKLAVINPRVEGGTRDKLGVNVEWVLGYTVVSRTRNVVEDKGWVSFFLFFVPVASC